VLKSELTLDALPLTTKNFLEFEPMTRCMRAAQTVSSNH